jgi:hypothetical protein
MGYAEVIPGSSIRGVTSGFPTTRPESLASSAMGRVGYNFRTRVALAVPVGRAIVKHLSGAIFIRSNDG